jgi:putative transposase
MPRRARIVIPDVPHHVTQRGNNKQNVFFRPADCRRYCRWTNKYCKEYGLKVLAYCLMKNHVHFIVIPQDSDALSLTFKNLHMRYAQYAHEARQTVGHVWQGRFYSCLLDEAHLYRAVRYVERNPVRAGLIDLPWVYPWSSAAAHTGEGRSRIELDRADGIPPQAEWKSYLMCGDEEANKEIRIRTHRGLAFAGPGFVESIERGLGCSLACRRRGRPKKRM